MHTHKSQKVIFKCGQNRGCLSESLLLMGVVRDGNKSVNLWLQPQEVLSVPRFVCSWFGNHYPRKVKVLVSQSCVNLCDPMDCSLPGSSVHGILQARLLEWVAILFSRGYSQTSD